MHRDAADPAGLGRGRLTRWLPVLWQAPETPPLTPPFELREATTARRFLLRVMFSANRFTLPAVACFVAAQIGESLVPVVMGVAIDRALAQGDVAQLALWLAVLAGVFLVVATGQRFAHQLVAAGQQRVQHRLRATLAATALHPTTGGGRAPDGGLISLMTNDVQRAAGIGLVVFPIGEVAAILFIAVSLLVIHWPLGLVALVGAPLVVWLMGAMSGSYARSSRAYQALLAHTVGRATDLVAGYRVIKGVRAEEEATARYRAASQGALDGAIRNAGRLGRFLGGSGAVSGIFVAVVAALAGWFTIEGQMSVGELIAAVGLAQALIPQMNMVTGNAVPAWAAANASAGRVLDRLRESADAARPTAEGRPAAALPPGVAAALEIADGGGNPIRVAHGEVVGLAADDVTSARIATALLHPGSEADHVRVLLAGTPTHRVEPGDYRAEVVVAPHAAMLFSGTVADNVVPTRAGIDAGGPGEQDDAALRAALRAAACEDFAEPTTAVGEMGNRLSGGQRQRVALARALAADAPILVLHEPTTAVDSVTEALVADRLAHLRAGRTTLIITAAPVLLGACDRVVDRTPAGSRDEDDAARGVRTGAGAP
ncbi:Methionine ABC transporter ATP-binding protein [Actinomycetales bacterium JB111]|nr:Methionine ABC transporter ATP-binding protein [Actinomycetales bacterium JB111]